MDSLLISKITAASTLCRVFSTRHFSVSLPVFGSFSFSLKVSENKPQRNTGHNNTLTIIHTVTNGAALFHCAVFVCFIEVSSFVEVSVGMSEN